MRAADLSEYLITAKQQEFTLVGVEQTANSKCLTEYQFPKKTLLLLGCVHGCIYTHTLLLEMCMLTDPFEALQSATWQMKFRLERVVLEYQLQNRVENLADVSTRCSGILQGEDQRPGQSIWSKRRQGFQPCFEAGIRELPFLMPEPAEKPSLHSKFRLVFKSLGCNLIIKVHCELAKLP